MKLKFFKTNFPQNEYFKEVLFCNHSGIQFLLALAFRLLCKQQARFEPLPVLTVSIKYGKQVNFTNSFNEEM